MPRRFSSTIVTYPSGEEVFLEPTNIVYRQITKDLLEKFGQHYFNRIDTRHMIHKSHLVKICKSKILP